MPAWVTPPVFSYGYPASVDDLNIVRNDLLYLFGEIFATSSATIESEVKCNSPFDSEKTAAILWIEHKTDNLYYRINIKSEDDDHDVVLHISYFEDPYGDPADEMGEHTENGNLAVQDTYYLFTNSDAAVDISGWGLTVGSIYQVKVQLTATNNDNDDCWVEVQFLYEAP